MENINITNQTKETAEHLSAYAYNQLEISKLLLIKKATKASSFVMFIFISSLFILFIAFMISIAIGLYLGEMIGSYPLAFLIMAGINLLFLLLLIIMKKAIIDNVLLRKLIKEI